LKAGLASDAWKAGDLEIQTYQVQYFHEAKSAFYTARAQI
jgi:AMMECR1 domain-containing protein